MSSRNIRSNSIPVLAARRSISMDESMPGMGVPAGPWCACSPAEATPRACSQSRIIVISSVCDTSILSASLRMSGLAVREASSAVISIACA
jgi:hypothetical protein